MSSFVQAQASANKCDAAVSLPGPWAPGRVLTCPARTLHCLALGLRGGFNVCDTGSPIVKEFWSRMWPSVSGEEPLEVYLVMV